MFQGQGEVHTFSNQLDAVLGKVLHEVQSSIPVVLIWRKLAECTDVAEESKCFIAMCIALAVFMICQKSVVSLKEGETLLLDYEQASTDSLEEAGLDVDEVSLFRLGGYALHLVIKAFEGRESNCRVELSVLYSVRMPLRRRGIFQQIFSI